MAARLRYSLAVALVVALVVVTCTAMVLGFLWLTFRRTVVPIGTLPVDGELLIIIEIVHDDFGFVCARVARVDGKPTGAEIDSGMLMVPRDPYALRLEQFRVDVREGKALLYFNDGNDDELVAEYGITAKMWRTPYNQWGGGE